MLRSKTAMIVFLVLWPRAALAGMPSISFSDVARLRLQTISFFLMGLLISAAVIMAIWNGLRRDFAWLPRLSYAKACGLVVLWGLLFIVVLTMISGARELMTPGAWEKNGLTYKLRNEPKAAEHQPDNFLPRYDRLSQSLRAALLDYADRHDGRYPSSKDDASTQIGYWDLPDLSGTQYVLVPGCRRSGPAMPLLYDPEV